MSVIKKVQSKVNFLRKSVLLIQLELEKYCFNDINYQFALKLCHACVATRIGDDVYKMGILYFGHLLTTYKNHTHHALQEVLRKRQKPGYPGNVFTDDLVNNHFGDDDFPFFECMVNDAFLDYVGSYADLWQLVRDKIEVLLKCQVSEPAVEKPLTIKEAKKLASLQKMAKQYDKAASYLLNNMRNYIHNFMLDNQISRATIYSNHDIVRSDAIDNIGYSVNAYKQKPDDDLIAELTNMYYHPTNIYYQGYAQDADSALRSIEANCQLPIRPPVRRENLQYYLEVLGNEAEISQNAKEEDDDYVWIKIHTLTTRLQNSHLWDENSDKQIGILLVNQEEASAMGKVVAVLKKLIANVGEKQGNESYLQAPEFAELMQAAGQAHQVLLANDEEFKKIYFK